MHEHTHAITHTRAHVQHCVIHIECPFRADSANRSCSGEINTRAPARVRLLQQLSFGGHTHMHVHLDTAYNRPPFAGVINFDHP